MKSFRIPPCPKKAFAIALGLAVSSHQLMAQRALGTDVSNHQGGGISWQTVKNGGISFAWAKATESTDYIDPDFIINMNGAKGVGIPIGAYDFAHPEANTPQAEANYFWAEAGPYILADSLSIQPMLDYETFTGTIVGATSYSDWANQWCSNVVAHAAAAGVKIVPEIYIGPCATESYLNSSVKQWINDIAAYPNNPNAQTGNPWTASTCTSDPAWGGAWNIWQYADTNISGGDSDVYNGTVSQMLAKMLAVPYGGGAPAGVTIYWDPSAQQTSPGSGGTGSWDTTTGDWWYSGSSNVSWSTGGDNAIFAGRAGTVTLNANVSADSVTFQTGSYTIAGVANSLTLTNTATISVPASATETFNCILGGTGLTVTGGGTVILNNTSNTSSSPFVIGSNTTLQVVSSHVFNPRAAAVTLNSGATLQNNDTVSGDVFLNPGYIIALGAGSETLSVPNTGLTYGGAMSGPGDVIKSGAGTLTLTAANNYTGNTTVNQGVLALGTGASINNSSGITIAAGGTLDVSAQSSWTAASNVFARGAGTSAGSTAATIKGPSNSVVSMGTSTLTLGYIPSTTNGDSIHPALYVSQGALSMSTNTTIVVSNASAAPMGVGVYVLIQQASGGISNAPNPVPQIEGAGVSVGTTNYLVRTNQYLFLVVSRITTTTLGSLTPSTYGQPVTLTATVSPTPAGGTLQFYDNGTALGKAVTVLSGTASLTTNSLTAGNHTISAFYNGVSAYAASWSAPAIEQVMPLPLSITANSQSKTFGQTLAAGPGSTNFTSSGLETGDTIGSVTLTVSSNGAAAGTPAGAYVITPSTATGGTFSTNNYSITYNTGILTITLPPNSAPVTITGPFIQTDGTVQLSFAGVPGYTYYIQAACDIDPPIDWTNIGTNTADTNGLFNFIDLDATNFPVRYYRTEAQQ